MSRIIESDSAYLEMKEMESWIRFFGNKLNFAKTEESFFPLSSPGFESQLGQYFFSLWTYLFTA